MNVKKLSFVSFKESLDEIKTKLSTIFTQSTHEFSTTSLNTKDTDTGMEV
jgi:hypothetical protein